MALPIENRCFRAFLFLFFLMLVPATGSFGATAASPGTAPVEESRTAIQPGDAAALAEALQNPQARAELIRQLEVLAQAEHAAAKESPVESATAQLLALLSERLSAFGASMMSTAGAINQLPDIADWFRTQATDPEARQVWIQLGAILAAVLGLAYAALYFVRVLLRHPRNVLARRPPAGVMGRLSLLLASVLLELLPIAVFAVVAYATLGVVDPQEKTRLVALVWVNAAIIVRLVQAAGSLVLSPAAPGLRLVPMADETANYAQIWLRRFAVVTVYGYLSLQGALLLGLPSAAYRTLLTLLGLLVTLLLVVIVLQNRVAIAVQIRGEATAGALRNVRARLAQVWHLLAISYVFLLFAIWTLHVEGGLVYVLQGTGLTAVVLVLTGLALGLLDRVFRHGLRVSARPPGTLSGSRGARQSLCARCPAAAAVDDLCPGAARGPAGLGRAELRLAEQ